MFIIYFLLICVLQTITKGNSVEVDYYIKSYTMLSFTALIFSLLLAFSSEIAGLKSAKVLHTKMLLHLIKAPIRLCRN